MRQMWRGRPDSTCSDEKDKKQIWTGLIMWASMLTPAVWPLGCPKIQDVLEVTYTWYSRLPVKQACKVLLISESLEAEHFSRFWVWSVMTSQSLCHCHRWILYFTHHTVMCRWLKYSFGYFLFGRLLRAENFSECSKSTLLSKKRKSGRARMQFWWSQYSARVFGNSTLTRSQWTKGSQSEALPREMRHALPPRDWWLWGSCRLKARGAHRQRCS